ncbi:uncharacterized protein LOC112514774 [Cynara cardunculus var. scolymus]|uniref:Uncharacterized protein n=1 Tax=Cynara cardunculus var. scolymus TaxID=59895 RepID=A0A118JYN6_CYNCS|nr:uncharacterized protein LOC112514774 [Cynara cardunculus var. scolymus]KVH98874.1 hypothetical protein Ccrd_022898 [Cynara cardunculus var. scolymus]
MEDALKHQSSVSGNKGGGSAKLLRYPLRSATKSRDDKPPISVPSTASRRGRPSSSVSQSVSALDLSAKQKSSKPPRRLSIPTKSTASPAPKPACNITPISEARANRSRNIEAKSDTPVSDVSSRKKFNVLSSASYWLSQIKLSEAAGKHQLSLGFFKLAQVAACENLQLLRNELQSYALRHNILDLGESAKEVLQSYEIPKCIEQVQVSETYCSHEPEQGTQSSSDEAHSLSSVNEIPKLKPRSSNNSAGSTAKESAKETNQKKLVSTTKSSTNKKTVDQQSALQGGRSKMQNDLPKPSKKSNKEKQMVKSNGKKSDTEGVVSSPEEAITEENKENMDGPPAVEISMET